jgi:hypothetical protein
MMQIDRVTITGADDSTDIEWMKAMSKEYPIVEWGILVSATGAGSPRFPSMTWLDDLRRLGDKTMDLSLHVCGRWVRDICAGNWGPLLQSVEHNLFAYRRVQLNFHGYQHLLEAEFFDAARVITEAHLVQLIFQLDGVNDLLRDNVCVGIDAVPLFDLSGGTGVVPDAWPDQTPGVYSGYAGGLGPDNIHVEIDRIRQVANGRIWIDMETKVRTADNQALDPDAVESVLYRVTCHNKD